MTGLEPSEPAATRPPVFLPSGNPLRILTACREVAVRADWRLAEWIDFRSAFQACFGAVADPGEFDAAMAVVESRFTVTLGPKFSRDPAQWRTTLTHQEPHHAD